MSDLLNRLYTMSSAIRAQTPAATRVAGLACTVKVFPGDNLMVHKALDLAEPGDVIVVDASSSVMTAVLGDMIATKAAHRGVAGLVVDGLIRDLPGIQQIPGMAVFARGVTPIGPLHRGPGEVNYAISCGGIVVNRATSSSATTTASSSPRSLRPRCCTCCRRVASGGDLRRCGQARGVLQRVGRPGPGW